jgi:hypothetical protein
MTDADFTVDILWQNLCQRLYPDRLLIDLKASTQHRDAA